MVETINFSSENSPVDVSIIEIRIRFVCVCTRSRVDELLVRPFRLVVANLEPDLCMELRRPFKWQLCPQFRIPSLLDERFHNKPFLGFHSQINIIFLRNTLKHDFALVMIVE